MRRWLTCYFPYGCGDMEVRQAFPICLGWKIALPNIEEGLLRCGARPICYHHWPARLTLNNRNVTANVETLLPYILISASLKIPSHDCRKWPVCSRDAREQMNPWPTTWYSIATVLSWPANLKPRVVYLPKKDEYESIDTALRYELHLFLTEIEYTLSAEIRVSGFTICSPG